MFESENKEKGKQFTQILLLSFNQNNLTTLTKIIDKTNFWNIFQERLWNLKRTTTFSQISFKILLCH